MIVGRSGIGVPRTSRVRQDRALLRRDRHAATGPAKRATRCGSARKPCAWVVQLEGNGQVAVAWERGDVAAGRVDGVERRHAGEICARVLLARFVSHFFVGGYIFGERS